MLPYKLFGATLAAAVVAFSASYARAEEFSARLNGFNVTGGLPGPTAAETGAILTDATGTLQLDFNQKSSMITYTLSYTGGFSSALTQAHIHFGKIHVPGGIIAFLCTNLSNGPAGTQSCPTAPAMVTGTLTAASVVGPTAQNVTAGVFSGLVDALKSNTAYANIHTVKFPAGEIRGQIHAVENDQDHDNSQGHNH
jgi:hypothetical protein